MVNKNKLLNNIILVCIVFITLGYVIDKKEMINTFFFIGLLSKFISFKINKEKEFSMNINLNKWDSVLIVLVFIFIFILFFISYFAYYPETSLKYAEHYFKWLLIPGAIILTLSYDKIDFMKDVIFGLIIGNLVVVVGIFWNFYILNIERPGSWLGLNHPNNAAGVIAFLLPFIIMQDCIKNILIKILIICISLTAVIITGSRGALIGIVAMFTILFFFKFKSLIAIIKNNTLKCFISVLIGLIILFGSLLNSNENIVDRFASIYTYKNNLIEHRVGGDRIVLWKSSIEMMKDYPITGVGLNNFNDVYIKGNYIDLRAKEQDLTSPHNIFLHLFVEAGFLGGIVFVLLIVFQLYYLWINKYLNEIVFAGFLSIIGMCIHGMVDYLFLIKNYYQLYWFVFWGIFIYVIKNRKFKIEI